MMDFLLSPWLVGSAFSACTVATVWDMAFQRIPNWLTVTTACIGFGIRLSLHGFSGLGEGFLGLLAGFSIFAPFYAVRWMGAGDVKLLMAVGACLGWRLGALAGLATLLIGALLAFLFLLMQGELLVYLRRYGVMVKALLFTGRFAYIPPDPGQSASLRFPYALAIALGTFAAIYGPAYWPFMRIPILSGG